jgi:molybdopterin synthase sulfur carrier subunit
MTSKNQAGEILRTNVMPVNVLIPTPLRKYTGEQETVTVAPGTVASLVTNLESQYPGIAARLTDDQGELRRFINIYVNEEDIRFLAGKDTEIKEGDNVSIVPAIAGG